MLVQIAWFMIISCVSGGSVFSSTDDDHTWWKYTTVYQIYPRSFKDSNGDGTGDLKGIESKLDYLVGLGITTVWLNPINQSPMVDFGYDISDFREIDPIFGTMEDFDSLMQQMKAKGLNLIMDFVPNHSSDKHVWFSKSVKKIEPYTDYYVWMDPLGYVDGSPIPPNNWISVFGGSAWEWNAERQQFYLHQFAIQQPDLNFRNEKVVQEFVDILKFWLDKGVAGFRMDAVAFLFEDPYFRNESRTFQPGVQPQEYDYLVHNYTFNLDGVLDIMYRFRRVLDAYSAKGHHRVMITEAYLPPDEIMSYYGNSTHPIGDIPFNFFFIDQLKAGFNAMGLHRIISMWMDNLPKGQWPNWVLGNHDNPRVASRFIPDVVDGLNMVALLLPGTPFTYYGEELGLINTPVAYADTVDVRGLNAGPDSYANLSRDPERTPMIWNDGKNAGFSDASKTWLPIDPNYRVLNVEAQSSGFANSHYKFYKKLVELRRMPSIRSHKLEMRVLNNGAVFAFLRHDSPHSAYLAVFNTGSRDVTVNLTVLYHDENLQEILKSVNYANQSLSTVSSEAVLMGPYNAIVLQSSATRHIFTYVLIFTCVFLVKQM